MKKQKLFMVSVFFLLLFAGGMQAQNVLTGTCPGYCEPSGGGAADTNKDAFYMLINTEANGDVTFEILGVPGNTTTLFRNNAWADGIIEEITVNGDPNTENKYFTRTINEEKTVVTLIKQGEIPAAADIVIHGILEYRTGPDPYANLWPTITIEFEYGTTCSFIQTSLATPTITEIDNDKKITFSSVANAGYLRG